MATLVKQHNWYYSQFYDCNRTPKRKRIPLKTKTRRRAAKLHRELEDQVAAGEFDPWTGFKALNKRFTIQKNSTLKEALDYYIEQKGAEDWRTNTKINTSYVLYDFARFVGEHQTVQNISVTSFNDFLNQGKFAYETKKSHKSKVKPFARWLKKIGIFNEDLSFLKIFNQDYEQDETISYLSKKEVRILKAGIREKVFKDIKQGYQTKARNALWLIDFIDWQRYSGMRISETLSLTPANINTESWEITIGSDNFSTKVKSKQVLPIGNVHVLKNIALKLIKNCHTSHDLLFQHKDRRRTSRTFKKYVRLFLPDREDIHVHSLRHTCCIELLRKEVPIYTVQRWMRHSSIRTTQKYADLLATDISKAVGYAFNDIF